MDKLIRSLKKNGIGISLMLISSLLVAFGQLLWKISNGVINFQLLVGFFLYGLGAVVMIAAYRFGRLSVLHPFLSFGYILSIFLGYFFFQETIGLIKAFGIMSITVGVILIGGGDDD